MKQIRRLHGWLGVLFAPSILLFAISGMGQMAGCHEGEGGEAPSALMARLAQLHMKQTIEMPRARAPRPAPPAAAAPGETAGSAQPGEKPPGGERPERKSTLPLKLFFYAMSLSLIASTVLGVWIAFTSKRDQKLHIGLLAAGVVLPVLLMMI